MATCTVPPRNCVSQNLLSCLPPDLFVRLVPYFDPRDILSLRRTCKSLQSATYERSIWVLFLLRICFSSSVFLPSFPMASMSSMELEHAVLVPEQFTALIKCQTSKQPGSLSPAMERTIRSEYPVWKVFLVPGGRYLVTFSPRLVGLWDLGFKGDGWDVPMDPIAKIEIRREMTNLDGLPQDMVHATTDGKGIQIAVVYEKSVEVHICYPADVSPTFMKITGLETSTTIWKTILTDTRVVTLLLGRMIVVWDFKEDLYTSWRIVEDPIGIYGMTIDSSTVSVLDEFWHATYVIPPFMPHIDTSVPSIDVHEQPTRLGDYQWHRYGHAGIQPVNWYLRTTQPLFMDLLQPMGRGRGYEVHRFLLGSRMATQKSGSQSNSIPLKATFRIRTKSRSHSIGALRKCGENIFKFWMWENQVCIHLGNSSTPFVESDKKSPDSFVRLLAADDNRPIHRPDVCPVSGRVASISLASNLHEVHITDYMP